MQISERGLRLVRESEGFVPKAYKDAAGLDTIGYGHLITRQEKLDKTFDGAVLSEEKATELLRKDLATAESAVISLVKVALNQNQFDALVDFVFNLGREALRGSTLLQRLNSGDYRVENEFMKWCRAKNPKTGKMDVLAGLQKRRRKEADLWAEPV